MNKFYSKWNILSGGYFALGFSLSALISVLLWVISKYSGTELNEKAVVESTSTIAAIIISSTASVIATLSLIEQRRHRQAGTDPVVLAHFGQRDDARELVTFEVTNVGAGAAMNVLVHAGTPKIADNQTLMTNIFDKDMAIRVIPQGQSVKFSLGFGFNLLSSPPLPCFPVKIKYEDIEGNEHIISYDMDIREMERLGAEKSPIMRVVNSLENIEKKLGSSYQ